MPREQTRLVQSYTSSHAGHFTHVEAASHLSKCKNHVSVYALSMHLDSVYASFILNVCVCACVCVQGYTCETIYLFIYTCVSIYISIYMYVRKYATPMS